MALKIMNMEEEGNAYVMDDSSLDTHTQELEY